jgi:glutathione peroxidase
MSDFYEFEVDGIDGTRDILKPLRGKVTLAVNVASRCGYTPQYSGLELLYQEIKDQNFTVLGFPCNQFGAQEPGTAIEIRSFCEQTYGVSFPLAVKIEVNGAHRHPLFAWLTAEENGYPGDIGWNFEKFLINRNGKLISRYPSGTKPQDHGLLQDLADVL